MTPRTWMLGAMLALSAPCFTACERKEGPMEKTGEELDEAGKKVEKGVREPGGD